MRLIPRPLIRRLFKSFEARDEFLLQLKTVRRALPDRPIAFAMFGGGVVEFLAIQLFLKEAFGDDFELRLATRLPSVFVENLSLNLRRVASFLRIGPKTRTRIRLCADELKAGRPVLLNFDSNERKKAFQVNVGETELEYLAQAVPNLVVTPIVIIWRRKKRMEESQNADVSTRLWRNFVAPFTSPWNLFLGDPYRPTDLRKFLLMLRGYAQSSLRLAMPFEVTEYPAKQLRRKIYTTITQEKRVTLGGVYRSTRLISETIFREPGFQQFVSDIAVQEKTTETAIYKRATKDFNEFAANFSYFTIEYAAWFLHKVFTKIFDDITVNDEDFERVRELSKEGALVFIPSHKSYVDFLVLSYLLFRKGLLPPHIAAGSNLNIVGLGRIFKKGGAFFIRRSFRGNVLYSEVLRRYMAELLNNRVGIEFFIEGARSRSGKLSPPKFGMLKMIVESAIAGDVKEKVRIIPVSIIYDRVTEESAHKRELEGGEKVQESALGVLKATKVLFKNFGKVHVRFGEGIRLEEAVATYMGDGVHSETTRKLGISKIAFEVCNRINAVSPITSFGVICAAIMAKPGAAIPRSQLDLIIDRIEHDARLLRVPMTPELETSFKWACQRAISNLLSDGLLEPYASSDGAQGLRIPAKQRIAALFYKNAFIHAFLLPGIRGLSVGLPATQLELRSLLQFEFFFSDKDHFIRQMHALPGDLSFELYAFMLEDVLENIEMGIDGLKKMSGLWLEAKEWKSRLMKFGRSTAAENPSLRFESVNTQGFSAFVEMSKNRQWLKLSPVKQSTLLTPAAETLLNEERLRVRKLRPTAERWTNFVENLEKNAHATIASQTDTPPSVT